jgi:hypothetical protein
MKKILIISSFILTSSVFAGPGLGSLLSGGVDDAGTTHNSDGSTGGAGIPVDGGLSLVVGASVLYGARKIKEYQNKK